MAVDSATRWLRAAGRVPLLTPAEELHLGSLIRAWQDHPAGPANAPPAIRRRGLKARDRMVSGNLRLVAKVAARRPGPADLADLLQSGALGLIRAAEKFDPARGYKFSTYAYWWVRQAIRPEHDAAPLIKVPAPVAAAVRGEPGGSRSAELVEAGRAARRITSIDAPTLEDGADLVETLAADAPGLAELEQHDAAEVALAAIRAADPDAAALLELRHGDGAHLRELAPLAGIRLKLLPLELTEARERLRKVPEVEALLAG